MSGSEFSRGATASTGFGGVLSRGRGTINMSQVASDRTRLLTLPRRKLPKVERPCFPATMRSAPSLWA